MPGRQKSGAEAPMDRGGGPASSPKAGLARIRRQMSRRRRKGMRGTPPEKRYGCMEDSKGAREKVPGQICVFIFETWNLGIHTSVSELRRRRDRVAGQMT